MIQINDLYSLSGTATPPLGMLHEHVRLIYVHCMCTGSVKLCTPPPPMYLHISCI